MILEDEKDKRRSQIINDLVSSQDENGELGIFRDRSNDYLDDETLTDAQKSLLTRIREKFDP